MVLRYSTAVDRLIEASRGFRFRGKFRLLDPFVPHEGEKCASVFGYEMNLDLSRKVQRDVYIGNYERAETRLVRSFLKSGMTVMDIGANIGYYTALAARMVGADGRVLAVEPYQPNFIRLDWWIRNNNVGQVRAFDFALGAAPATAQMYSAFANTGAPVMVARDQPSVAVVEVRTLDSCLDEWKLDRVDFLKLDVDGSETAVLAGACGTLAAHKIRAILCEFSLEWLAHVGSSAEALWATLVSAGFEPVWPSSKMPSSSLFNQFFVQSRV
jgi:FkbM family methyltransferase